MSAAHDLPSVRQWSQAFGISRAQRTVYGRYIGRRGYAAARVDSRGVVRLFHPRYVGAWWEP